MSFHLYLLSYESLFNSPHSHYLVLSISVSPVQSVQSVGLVQNGPKWSYDGKGAILRLTTYFVNTKVIFLQGNISQAKTPKWFKVGPNSLKLSEIVQNGQINKKWLKLVPNGAKFSKKKVEIFLSGLIWTDMVQKVYYISVATSHRSLDIFTRKNSA